jgi:hypothetical protein
MPQMARFRGFEPETDERAVAVIVAGASENRLEPARVDTRLLILPLAPRH